MSPRRFYNLLWLCCLLACRAAAQDTLVRTGKLPFVSLSAWGETRPGQLLLVDERANLYLYDLQGQRLDEQSLPVRLALNEVHSRGGVQTLLFSLDTQQLFFIDRFLRLTRQLQIPFTFGNITALAWAPDGSVRLWDSQSRRLLAWDMSAPEPQELYRAQEEFPAVTHMRFVQNYLLLTDEKTYVLFFDLLGNYIDKIYFRESIDRVLLWQEGYCLQEGSRLRGWRLPDRQAVFDVRFHENEKGRIGKILCLYPAFLSWNGTHLQFWQFKK
ncbi:hypothetical protein [Thermonema rossianum]|uniref:hypothetical protein n=1 Tax=Thermonema rossianum TaxID=55505 RepID=UPI00056E8BF0|nr:hypothetical protein [Thermonema rossianum]